MKALLTVFFVILISFLFTSCDNTRDPKPGSGPDTDPKPKSAGINPNDVLFDFVYVGCNRVTHHDRSNPKTDASTANLAQLKKIYKEVSQLVDPPEYFFFLGDMVLGESDTTDLRTELKQWVADFYDHSSGGINQYWNNNIKMVAIPGNHEMLLSKKVNGSYEEFPLAGATKVWMDEMKSFIPGTVNRDQSSPYQEATYTFQHGNTFFVIMNTDTYNTNKKTGQIPTSWITAEMAKARANPAVKHILVLGHKPAYRSSSTGALEIDDQGLATIHSDYVGSIWSAMQTNQSAAMLSAHVHAYNRFQPNGSGSFQIIAGNGGSLNGENSRHDCARSPDFFGYSHIYVMKSGALIHKTRGWQIGPCYYLDPVPADTVTCTYDSLNIAWGQQAVDWSFGSGVNCR